MTRHRHKRHRKPHCWCILTLSAALLANTGASHAQTPARGSQLELLATLDRALRDGVTEGCFPGAVLLVAQAGHVVTQGAWGEAVRFTPTELPLIARPTMHPDTIFDLASLTKLFTATAILQLTEKGVLELDRTIVTYLPEFAQTTDPDNQDDDQDDEDNGAVTLARATDDAKNDTTYVTDSAKDSIKDDTDHNADTDNDDSDADLYRDKVTVRQLLAHRAGLPPWGPLYLDALTPELARAAALRVPLIHPPGEARIYSDYGYIIVGMLLENLTGLGLDAYLEHFVTGPLGLTRTRFNPPYEWQQTIAATEAQAWTGRALVWGAVHDENAWRMGGVAGHAGLFSSAADLARFVQTLLDGGQYEGVRILAPTTVALMFDPKEPLAWSSAASFMGGFATRRNAFGHTGFTGTSVIVDTDSRSLVVLLTNRVHPSRDGPSLTQTRQEIADLALALLGLNVASSASPPLTSPTF